MDRRQFILSGIAVGASVSLGIAGWQYGNEQPDDSRDWVLSALLPALLYGALPPDTTLAQAELARSKFAVINFMPYLSQRQQRDLQQLFDLLANRVTQLALTGHLMALPELSIAQRLQILTQWRDSYLAVLQQAYYGLRELLMAAYYGQPEHWQSLAYTAPRFR
jgi:hypothetical protein